MGNGKRKIVGTVSNTSTSTGRSVLITRGGKYNVIYIVEAQTTLTCELEVGDVFYPNYNSNWASIRYSDASGITFDKEENSYSGEGFDNFTVTTVENGFSVTCYVPRVK